MSEICYEKTIRGRKEGRKDEFLKFNYGYLAPATTWATLSD